jgi:probable F420-dependent oxidoreductase
MLRCLRHSSSRVESPQLARSGFSNGLLAIDMKLGVAVRTMGPQSNRELLVGCVQAAERLGLDDVWVQDHVAIPPDDAEGSGGRYLDPLTTLAYLAACSSRIGLGSGVLNIPYRAPLPTAKALATIQELSGGRLRLGIGVGWMHAEFRALGVPRNRRGALTDEGLSFIRRCFESDEVEAHGQPFLFLPRPERPPIYVGGSGLHALERTVAFADGWLPMGGDPAKLREPILELRELAAKAGKAPPEVKLMTALPLDELDRAIQLAGALAEVGVTSLIQGVRYSELAEFESAAARLVECGRAL